MLSQARKDFIDAHFHENVAEQDLNREAFNQLQTPQELDYLAKQHNWDNGVQLMLWVAQSPLCSRATAAEIFWLSQPQEYQGGFKPEVQHLPPSKVRRCHHLVRPRHTSNFSLKSASPLPA